MHAVVVHAVVVHAVNVVDADAHLGSIGIHSPALLPVPIRNPMIDFARAMLAMSHPIDTSHVEMGHLQDLWENQLKGGRCPTAAILRS